MKTWKKFQREKSPPRGHLQKFSPLCGYIKKKFLLRRHLQKSFLLHRYFFNISPKPALENFLLASNFLNTNYRKGFYFFYLQIQTPFTAKLLPLLPYILHFNKSCPLLPLNIKTPFIVFIY